MDTAIHNHALVAARFQIHLSFAGPMEHTLDFRQVTRSVWQAQSRSRDHGRYWALHFQAAQR